MKHAVDCFVESYLQYFETEIDVQSSTHPDDNQMSDLVEQQRLIPNVVGDSVTRLFKERVGPLPDAFEAFLVAPGCSWWLDALLMTIPALGSPSGLSQVEGMLELCVPGLAPFGMERDGYGLGHYCIDLRADGTRGAVVYCPHPALESNQRVSGPIASSFDHMLRIFANLLTTHVPWAELGAPAVSSLRAIDPRGFGGDAWDQWWRFRILGF